MELTRNKKIVIAVVYTLTAVAVGRYTVPKSIKTTKETSKQEDIVKDKEKTVDKGKVVTIIITERTNLDGTVTKRTKTVTDNKDLEQHVHKDEDKKDETSKETKVEVAKTGRLNVSALVGTNVTDPTGLLYGLHISKDIIGPVSIGVFGLSNGSCGASIGLSF